VVAEVRLNTVLAGCARPFPLRRVGYILKPETAAFPTFSSERRGHWLRAAAAEPSLGIRPWVEGERYPGSSVPALVAAQAAMRQGDEVADAFHFRLFRTFLVENRDISAAAVLEQVALGAGLALDRFRIDCKDPTLKETVYAEHLEAIDLWKAEAVPTIIIGEERIEGAAPPAVYEMALARFAAGA
jgi:predicted DsbA family dithiol-disulfide isomerase